MEQGTQVLLQVFGGLALFLYGTDSLCRAVQQGAGRRLRSLLARCTANPVAGLLTGAAVTAVLQSSSAVTVMAIAFLAAGLLQLRRKGLCCTRASSSRSSGLCSSGSMALRITVTPSNNRAGKRRQAGGGSPRHF